MLFRSVFPPSFVVSYLLNRQKPRKPGNRVFFTNTASGKNVNDFISFELNIARFFCECNQKFRFLKAICYLANSIPGFLCIIYVHRFENGYTYVFICSSNRVCAVVRRCAAHLCTGKIHTENTCVSICPEIAQLRPCGQHSSR